MVPHSRGSPREDRGNVSVGKRLAEKPRGDATDGLRSVGVTRVELGEDRKPQATVAVLEQRHLVRHPKAATTATVNSNFFFNAPVLP